MVRVCRQRCTPETSSHLPTSNQCQSRVEVPDTGPLCCSPPQLSVDNPGDNVTETEVVWTGGLGAVGSLVALWLLQHTTAQLWLLGRSGRAADDAAFKPDLAGEAQVFLARGDVSSSEETAFVLRSAVSSAQTLEVQQPTPLTCR